MAWRTGSALLFLALSLAAPADARPGQDIASSVAIAKAQKVPFALFVTRHERVVCEEWHSYTTPSQESGPSWGPARSHALRQAMMGGQKPRSDAGRKVPWAGFPVWTFGYAKDQWVLYGSKRGAARIWSIMGTASWYWADAPAIWFVMPDDTRAYKLLNGKLIQLAYHPPKPSPAVGYPPRPKPSADFPGADPFHR